jgi:hypothetical protein
MIGQPLATLVLQPLALPAVSDLGWDRIRHVGEAEKPVTLNHIAIGISGLSACAGISSSKIKVVINVMKRRSKSFDYGTGVHLIGCPKVNERVKFKLRQS